MLQRGKGVSQVFGFCLRGLLGAGEAGTRCGLADGPVGECHSRDEGLHGVCRERGVRGQRRVCGVSQRRGVDVGVKSWGQRPVGRLLHRT